ncbi:hypothetical protein HYW20_07655 [Candidatus Woesearchaeota archaeon]|nr:hypothetical protein [Candidatus Woesearchaeota archaeon]
MKLNKKIIIISLLLIALVVVLSSTAYAKPFTEAFKGGLIEINNFFEQENYKPYSKTIDFVFFSLLFISIYMIGVRYAFKEVKRPETLIAVLLGLMSAFLLVLGGFSATILLPYLNWLLYTLLFILYWWLLKGIKNKFWRFILALLLTLLTIALVQGLFGAFAPPELRGAETGIGGFFKSFGDSFKGFDFGFQPGLPSYLQDLFEKPAPTTTTEPAAGTTAKPPAEPAKPEPAVEPGFFAKNWWWMLLIPLLAGGVYLGRNKLKNLKDWFKPKEGGGGEAEKDKEELTIQKIIDEISDYIKKKIEILRKINEIVARKKALTKLQRDLYYKAIEFDKAYWIDPDSEATKLFEKHGQVIGQLLELELKLETELKDLMGIERELVGFIARPLGMVGMSPFKRGKAGRWIILLEGPFDEKRSKEISEEIDKIEKLTPLLMREKFLDLVKRLLDMKEEPEWYKYRFKRTTNLIDELIMTYQWDPQTMSLIIREPKLTTSSEGTATIERDSNGRVIWTYPSNVPGQPQTIVPGGSYARWTINPDDMKVLQGGWFADSPSICEVVMRYISYYLLIARDETYKQKAWKKLVNPKELEKVVKNRDRWKAIKSLWKGKPQEEIPDILNRHFEEENIFFNTRFKPAVYKELQHMYEIIRHLKYLTSEREETTMQELRVEYFDAAGEKKEYSEGNLKDHNFVIPVIPRDKFMRVYTLLATGKGPTFKLACSVRTPPDNPLGGQFVKDNELVRGATDRYLPKAKSIQKTEEHPILEWKSEEFIDRFGDKLTDGEHEIYLYLVGPKPTETPQTPIAQGWRDMRSIIVRIASAPQTQQQRIKINKPAPNSEYAIGDYIDDLEAEAVSDKEDWNKQVNTGSAAYMHFEWYIVQGKLAYRIHSGRTGPRNLVSSPIPGNLAPGPAVLLVRLFDANGKQYLDNGSTTIILKEQSAKKKTARKRIRATKKRKSMVSTSQLGISVAVDPPDATDEIKGVEVGTIVKFNYEIMSGGLPLNTLTKLGSIDDDKGIPKDFGGVVLSLNETQECTPMKPGRHTFKIMVYGRGQKAEATREIYVKEKKTARLSPGLRRPGGPYVNTRNAQGRTDQKQPIDLTEKVVVIGRKEPYSHTPPTSEEQKKSITFSFDELFTAAREMRWDDVKVLIESGEKYLYLTNDQMVFLRGFFRDAKNKDYRRAGALLSGGMAIEVFPNNPKVISEFESIVASIRPKK